MCSLSYLYLTFFFLVNLGGVHVERIIAYGMRFSYYIVMIYYIDLFASRVLRGPSWNHSTEYMERKKTTTIIIIFYTYHFSRFSTHNIKDRDMGRGIENTFFFYYYIYL